MSDEDLNGWGEFKRLILFRLDNLDENMEKLQKAVTQIDIQYKVFMAKTSVVAAIAGTIAAILVSAASSVIAKAMHF